jgi:maltooligosyltrehalose trehalohydrolase
VDACHPPAGRLLDVVYSIGIGSHLAEFGPYFTDAHVTPWGRR